MCLLFILAAVINSASGDSQSNEPVELSSSSGIEAGKSVVISKGTDIFSISDEIVTITLANGLRESYYYTFVALDDCYLVCTVSPMNYLPLFEHNNYAQLTEELSGKLRLAEDSERSQIEEFCASLYGEGTKEAQEAQALFSDYVLETKYISGTQMSSVILVTFLPFIILGLFVLIVFGAIGLHQLAVVRNPQKHSLYRQMLKLGNADSLIAQFDREAQNPYFDSGDGDVMITQSFILSTYSSTVMRTEGLVRTYIDYYTIRSSGGGWIVRRKLPQLNCCYSNGMQQIIRTRTPKTVGEVAEALSRNFSI